MKRNSACTVCAIATIALAAGCFGEDEKPRPDFMSQPATTSQNTPTSNKPAPSTPPAAPVAPTPAADDTRADPVSETPRTADESELEPDEDLAWQDEPIEDPDLEEDLFAADEPEDELALTEDEDESESEDEEPREQLGAYMVRVPRPLATADLPPVASDIPEPPSPSQLAKVTAPWKPKSQDEIEALLARERAEDLTPEQIEALPNYFEIPAPPNPEANLEAE